MGGACWGEVCVSTSFCFVLGCDHTRAVLDFIFHNLFLHAPFAKDIRKNVFLFDFALTQILLLF